MRQQAHTPNTPAICMLPQHAHVLPVKRRLVRLLCVPDGHDRWTRSNGQLCHLSFPSILNMRAPRSRGGGHRLLSVPALINAFLRACAVLLCRSALVEPSVIILILIANGAHTMHAAGQGVHAAGQGVHAEAAAASVGACAACSRALQGMWAHCMRRGAGSPMP